MRLACFLLVSLALFALPAEAAEWVDDAIRILYWSALETDRRQTRQAVHNAPGMTWCDYRRFPDGCLVEGNPVIAGEPEKAEQVFDAAGAAPYLVDMFVPQPWRRPVMAALLIGQTVTVLRNDKYIEQRRGYDRVFLLAYRVVF